MIKKIELISPIPIDIYAISLYYKKGSDMTENMTKPIPKTVKLLIKVKLFLKLLSLSFVNILLLAVYENMLKKELNSCG